MSRSRWVRVIFTEPSVSPERWSNPKCAAPTDTAEVPAIVAAQLIERRTVVVAEGSCPTTCPQWGAGRGRHGSRATRRGAHSSAKRRGRFRAERGRGDRRGAPNAPRSGGEGSARSVEGATKGSPNRHGPNEGRANTSPRTATLPEKKKARPLNSKGDDSVMLAASLPGAVLQLVSAGARVPRSGKGGVGIAGGCVGNLPSARALGNCEAHWSLVEGSPKRSAGECVAGRPDVGDRRRRVLIRARREAAGEEELVAGAAVGRGEA